MKKICLFVWLNVFVCCATAQEYLSAVSVDERTELMSTVFRLAHAPEYSSNTLPVYQDKVNDYFASYENHPVVAFAQDVMRRSRVSYDAVMAYALHLQLGDTLSLNPELEADEVFSRWNSSDAETFLHLLNDFYRKSRYHEFFQNQSVIRRIAEERFVELLLHVNYTWMTDFFGKDADDYAVIVSLMNGGNNYGIGLKYRDGHRKFYSIMGTLNVDQNGAPIYSQQMVTSAIHEFCHYFCNPLIDEFWDQMRLRSEEVYAVYRRRLGRQIYDGAKVMTRETLVRATMIHSSKGAQSPELVRNMIRSEEGNGFVMMQTYCDALDRYAQNRDQYPSFQAFMPELTRAHNDFSLKNYLKKSQKLLGRIVKTSIKNNAKNVPYGDVLLTVTFDGPMTTERHGITYGNMGRQYFPQVCDREDKAFWNPDNPAVWNIWLRLEPDQTYSLTIPGRFFMTADGYPVEGDYNLQFKTKSK